MEFLLLLILVLLIFSALILGMFSESLSNFYSGFISMLLVFISFIFSIIIAFGIYTDENTLYYGNFYNWISVSGLNIGIGYLIDKFSSTMIVLVLFISFVVHVYSIAYMDKEKDFKRFFSYISLFTFFMTFLAMSNNFIQLFIGWEGVGLLSYLLIGFFYKKNSATRAGLKSFLINRIGDMFFILGIAMIYSVFNSFDFKEIFININVNTTQGFEKYFGLNYLDFACLILFFGAMTKSAQIPLHIWLPDSMEAPTPVSALIHAATMVTAGIFMVGRLSPLYELTDFTLDFILIIGASTAFFIGLLAIFENDIKKIIAYSTISQLGYMVAALGISAYTASFFHLFTHAFFKALLFLCAGSIIMSLNHNQDIRMMGGLKEKLPITYKCFIVGTLCIIGFPLTSGFFSKDLILLSILSKENTISFVAYNLLILSSIVTTVYSLRLLYFVFHGRYKGKDLDKISEQSFLITIPLITLSVLSLISGYMIEFFVSMPIFIYGISSMPYDGFISFIISGIFSALTLTLFLGYYIFLKIYQKKWSFKNNLINSLYLIIKSKYKFDEFFIICFLTIKKISIIFAYKFDITFIDNMLVNGFPKQINNFSRILKSTSTGYIYHYAFSIVFSIVVIIGIILMRIL